jgi:transposase
LGGTDPPAVAYTYAPGRGAVHAFKLLDHYRGIVQCDGYAAYKTIANVACDFFDIAQGGPAPPYSHDYKVSALLTSLEFTFRASTGSG